MREPPINICPLMSDTPALICLGARCAWWDFGANKCVMVSAVTAAQEIAENLEALASKSQTFGFLDRKTAPSAANTESGKETPQSR